MSESATIIDHKADEDVENVVEKVREADEGGEAAPKKKKTTTRKKKTTADKKPTKKKTTKAPKKTTKKKTTNKKTSSSEAKEGAPEGHRDVNPEGVDPKAKKRKFS